MTAAAMVTSAWFASTSAVMRRKSFCAATEPAASSSTTMPRRVLGTYGLASTPYRERIATQPHAHVGGAVGIGDAKATSFTVNPVRVWEGSGWTGGEKWCQIIIVKAVREARGRRRHPTMHGPFHVLFQLVPTLGPRTVVLLSLGVGILLDSCFPLCFLLHDGEVTRWYHS